MKNQLGSASLSVTKEPVARLALVVFSIIISLTLAEVSFRVLGLAPEVPTEERYKSFIESIPTTEKVPFQSTEFFQYHPIFGHAGVPNVRGFRKDTTGAMLLTTTNSKGYRDIDHDYARENPNTRRILLLGDSDVWGAGVADDWTTTSLLRKNLAQSGRSDVEVISLGIAGYGIDQSYLQYEVEGMYYEPNFVVFEYFAENDLFETSSPEAWEVQKPLFYLSARGWCLGNIPPKRASGWVNNKVGNFFEGAPSQRLSRLLNSLIQNSALIRYFANREFRSGLLNSLPVSWTLGSTTPFSRLAGAEKCVTKDFVPNSIPPLELGLEIIKRLNEKVKRSGAEFLVVGKPYLEEYQRSETSRNDYEDFKAGVKALGIEFLDMREEGKKHNISADEFFEISRHLSGTGHELLAQKIIEWMDRTTPPKTEQHP